MLAFWAQLAAAPALSETAIGFLLLLVSAMALAVWAIVERRRRMEVLHRLEALASRLHAEQNNQPDRTEGGGGGGGGGDEIQRRLGELHVQKMEAEVALLQRQLSEQTVEADRLEASKEFHELMVEKTRLEMDSMRLHIAEQRRRIDDWHAE